MGDPGACRLREFVGAGIAGYIRAGFGVRWCFSAPRVDSGKQWSSRLSAAFPGCPLCNNTSYFDCAESMYSSGARPFACV